MVHRNRGTVLLEADWSGVNAYFLFVFDFKVILYGLEFFQTCDMGCSS